MNFLKSETYKWLQENKERSDGRFPTFVKALELLTKYNGKNIVETGCVRQEDDWGAGYSTVIFGRYCKEFGARVLFYRAKHALRQRLSRHGFGKEMLLAGLGLFGILTLPTKATSTACSVNTASLNVGVVATLVGSLGTRMGIAVITSISAILAAITFQHLIMSIVVIAMVLLGLVIVGLYAGLD